MSLKDKRSTKADRESRLAEIASRYTNVMDKEECDPTLTPEEKAWLDAYSEMSKRQGKAWEQHVVKYRIWALAKSNHGPDSTEAVEAREQLDAAITELTDSSKQLNAFLDEMPGVVNSKHSKQD